MDVPNGPHLWQHVHNEGLKLERVTLILDLLYDYQPSERDPTACMALVELLKEAGGDNETIRNQCIELNTVLLPRLPRRSGERDPWAARHGELHLRPPGYPRSQLRRRGRCREAHL